MVYFNTKDLPEEITKAAQKTQTPILFETDYDKCVANNYFWDFNPNWTPTANIDLVFEAMEKNPDVIGFIVQKYSNEFHHYSLKYSNDSLRILKPKSVIEIHHPPRFCPKITKIDRPISEIFIDQVVFTSK